MHTVWAYIDEQYPHAADGMFRSRQKALRRVAELAKRGERAWIEPTTQAELDNAREADAERQYCADAAEAEFGNY